MFQAEESFVQRNTRYCGASLPVVPSRVSMDMIGLNVWEDSLSRGDRYQELGGQYDWIPCSQCIASKSHSSRSSGIRFAKSADKRSH